MILFIKIESIKIIKIKGRINIKWVINEEKPFSKKFIANNASKNTSNFLYALIVFLISSSLLLFIPTNNKFELREDSNYNHTSTN